MMIVEMKIRVTHACMADFTLSFLAAKAERIGTHIIPGNEQLFWQRKQTFSCC